jgi:hypothetical protein
MAQRNKNGDTTPKTDSGRRLVLTFPDDSKGIWTSNQRTIGLLMKLYFQPWVERGK